MGYNWWGVNRPAKGLPEAVYLLKVGDQWHGPYQALHTVKGVATAKRRYFSRDDYYGYSKPDPEIEIKIYELRGEWAEVNE